MSRVVASFTCAALLLVGGAHLAAAAAETYEARGQVVNVDAVTRSLVLETMARGKAERLSFVVGRDATLMRGARAISLAELRPGEEATVVYDTRQNRRHVERITIAKAAPAPAKGARPSR